MPASPSARLLRTAALVAAVLVTACDQPAPDTPAVVREAPATDSTPDTASVTLAPSSYDPAMGALLVLPIIVDGTKASSVALLSPGQSPDLPVGDTTGLRARLGSGRVELFARSGKVGERTVAWDERAPSPGTCAAWPTGEWVAQGATNESGQPSGTPVPVGTAPGVSADPLAAGSASPRWLVALPQGRARAIPLDSIESLGSRDSASLAATLARLASALPEDSSSPFRGLPFTVQRAYRSVEAQDSAATTPALAEGFVVGVLVRRIPQEDRPLEERLLVVVSAPGSNTRRWSIAWHERTSGREEEVIATEPLAALRVGSEAPYTALILGRDDGSGASLAVLEHRANRWRVRWESPVTGC